jgi:hypothetical protein
MLHDGCNKMSHCNCYTPHIKQVQHVLEIELKFQNPQMLFTYPDTSETTKTLQKTHTHTHRTGYQKSGKHFDGLYFMKWWICTQKHHTKFKICPRFNISV